MAAPFVYANKKQHFLQVEGEFEGNRKKNFLS